MARLPRITSRFEIAVIVALAGIFGLVMFVAEAQSERLAMTLAIRNMRSGLQWAIAEKIMRGEEGRMAELATTNPLEYIGSPNETGARGRWHFDSEHHELVYQPRIRAAFDGSRELRWRIEGSVGGDGRVIGLRLKEVASPADQR